MHYYSLICVFFYLSFANSQNIFNDERTTLFSISGLSLSTFELNLTRNELLLGARNKLLRLNIRNLSDVIEQIEWKAEKRALLNCHLLNSTKEKCENFVQTLIWRGNRIFVCGTNAGNPLCAWTADDNLATLQFNSTNEKVSKLLSPSSTNYNTTIIISEDGQFYSGIFIEQEQVFDFIRLKSTISTQTLHVVPNNHMWLNDPQFISLYENDQHVYMLFRERVYPNWKCGGFVYSRIARVCKDDAGGVQSYRHFWSSFVKARLNCSLSGRDPFYFDYLQDSVLIKEGSRSIIYGIFTTGPTSVHGSAICSFDLKDVDESFQGRYLYFDNADKKWSSVKSDRGICNKKLSTKKTRTHIIAEKLVPHQNESPILFADNQRWIKFVIDIVKFKNDIYQIFYVVNLEGNLMQMLKIGNVTCILNERNLKKPAKKLQLFHDDTTYLIAMTSEKIIKIPAENCKAFKTDSECFSSQNPYCVWDAILLKCVYKRRTDDTLENDRLFRPLINSCPSINQQPIAKWSNWRACSNYNGGQCLCRNILDKVQVANCTVDGRWSIWSEWSGCSKSCEQGHRSRKRTCSNPSPKFGGTACFGLAVEKQACLQRCKIKTDRRLERASWKDWSEWSRCSKQCNEGFQKRHRRCSHGGVPCIGDRTEWRLCNNSPCRAFKKYTKWTNWLISNMSVDGTKEQVRYRYACKANVDRSYNIKLSKPKIERRRCINRKCQFYESSEVYDDEVTKKKKVPTATLR